ncbi:uncharacterized protein PHALS_06015 [Plasmopara halstedii]|uniref:Uncharacterized protein n=1 Tax=Plasmopara halstedii TaxID=4781 RepID=A0A0P1ABF2_PLAHL|nr:uncharacterized protein PHALS_06015 [Plasmopara halstedii]CEG37970.1 hypothetical protein PHALS_06015 [Plasmopara halstedii]|eukprot:XP_024574339.1 hypothetical protein PHALS_06015 [Plasmopara halstedii]
MNGVMFSTLVPRWTTQSSTLVTTQSDHPTPVGSLSLGQSGKDHDSGLQLVCLRQSLVAGSESGAI